MKRKQVEEIMIPFKEGNPLNPSVSPEDLVTLAIELMINNDLNCITVTRKNRPVGLIYLRDAFVKLGLHIP